MLIKKRCEAGSSSIEWRVEFRDDSLPGYELRGKVIELSRVFGIVSCRIMVRKE
jgi:hypothetical protein